MAFHIARGSARAWAPVAEVPGLRQCVLVGAPHGSVHMQVELLELDPGAEVPAHLHPYENSWYVLDGSGRRDVGGLSYEIAEADYGLSPVGFAHRIVAGPRGMRWLSVSAPRPPAYSDAVHDIPAELAQGVPLGRPSETDPRHQWAGHFSESDIAPYAQLSMPGYHGANIKNIAVHMLVDELLGAAHHTMFMVEFAAGIGAGEAAGEHYHPFEEAYFLLSGSALGTLDGEEVTVSAGDLVWTGTDATHGFINLNDQPVRWIEVQSPVPPRSNAFFFPADWAKLAAAD
jgi:quercetin dioxygenase-like cupin family protein